MNPTDQPQAQSDGPHKFPWLVTVVVLVSILGGIYWWGSGNRDSSEKSDDLYSYSAEQRAQIETQSQGAPSTETTNNQDTNNLMHTITIETTKGTIVFETYDADAPKTVDNFITLASKGYYDGIIFHRVIQGFMIQGGDPTGTGAGGPGYEFADELDPSTESYRAGYVRGTVAMANRGSDTNGSQFFIMHQDTPLPHNYTIFGRVVSGMDVVDAIATTPVDGSDRPLEEVSMKKVTVASK